MALRVLSVVALARTPRCFLGSFPFRPGGVGFLKRQISWMARGSPVSGFVRDYAILYYIEYSNDIFHRQYTQVYKVEIPLWGGGSIPQTSFEQNLGRSLVQASVAVATTYTHTPLPQHVTLSEATLSASLTLRNLNNTNAPLNITLLLFTNFLDIVVYHCRISSKHTVIKCGPQ